MGDTLRFTPRHYSLLQVLIIGEEESPPYSRPPLSKQLWLYEDHDATKQLKFKAAWSGGKLVE